MIYLTVVFIVLLKSGRATSVYVAQWKCGQYEHEKLYDPKILY